MKAVLWLYQFWRLFFYCYCVPHSQNQWLSSLAPAIAQFSASSSIPWIVSIDETCQGIILNQWWILSTINCLTKLKYLHSDNKEVINKEGILFGHKICLHPSFNPRDGINPVKGDIGVVLLQFPLRRKQISLSHTYIFTKSRFNCVYRHCIVYQYQKHHNYGTSLKKLSVKLLDHSFCHHQHLHMPKTNNLCIWSHLKEDCWVQQGSPVLCLFGRHWELVGLVKESSMICDDPVLVIKTAPYLSWLKTFIKIHEKPLDSTYSPLCSFYPGIEHSIITNTGYSVFSSHEFSLQSWSRSVTSSQSRQRRNLSPVFFVSNYVDSFPKHRQLYFQGDQFSSSSRFPMAQSWTSTTPKILGISDTVDSCNNIVHNNFECFILSEAQNHKIVDRGISLDFPYRNAKKNEYRIMTDSIKSWTEQLYATINDDFNQFSKEIDGFQVHSKIYTNHYQSEFITFPLLGQFIVESWLESTLDTESWTQTHSLSDETGKWTPISKEIIRTKIYYVVETITTGANLEAYRPNSLVTLLVNEFELWTHSAFSEYESQYPSVSFTLGTWFHPVWHVLESQITSSKTDEYWISPETKSTLLCSTFAIPFPWTISKGDFMSWSKYKVNNIRPSSHMAEMSSLRNHEPTIIKPQIHTENTAWPLFHSITIINTIKPFIHYKVDKGTFWTQSDSAIHQTQTLSETESGKYLTTMKADTVRLWLQTKQEEITLTGKNENKYWMESKSSTIISWAQTEGKTVIPWNQSNVVKNWLWSKYNTLLETQSDFKSLQLFTYLKADTVSSWTQSIGNKQPWTNAFIVKPWIYPKNKIVIPWMKPEDNNAVVLFQVHDTRTWNQPESQTNHYLSQTVYDRIITWYHVQMDNFKTWMETSFQILPHWVKTEDDMAKSWIQIQDESIKHWFHTQMETVAEWTEPATQTAHKWIVSETKTDRYWNQPIGNKLRSWIQHKVYTVKLLNELNVGIIKSRVHKEVSTLFQWIHTGSVKLYPWSRSEPDFVMLWTQADTPLVHDWMGLLADTGTTWINSQFQELKGWGQSKTDRSTTWIEAEDPLLKTWTLSEIDTLTLWTSDKSPNLVPLIHPITNTMSPWTPTESSIISKTVIDSVTLWAQAKLLVTILCTKTVWNKFISWSQAESQEINNWMFPDFDSIPLCTQINYPEKIFPSEFKHTTVMLWTNEYPILNLREQVEIDTITQLTETESLETSWPHCISETIFSNQANSQSVPWINLNCDVITTWFQAQTKSLNPWTLRDKDTVTAWTEYDVPENNLWSETKLHIHSPWIQSESPKENHWTQSETVTELGLDHSLVLTRWAQPIDDIEKLWTQDEFSALIPFTVSVANIFTTWIQSESSTINRWILPTFDKVVLQIQAVHLTEKPQKEVVVPQITVWLKGDSPLENLWIQKISNTVILPWSQVIYLPLNPWPLTIPYTVIPQLFQAEYVPFNLWRKPISPIVIQPWPQTELVNQATQPVSNTKILQWSETELIPEYVWILPVTDTFILQWPQDKSPPINAGTLLISDTIILPWSQFETPEINLTLLGSDRNITAWFQSDYSTANKFTFSIPDKVPSLLSQTKTPPVYVWEFPLSYITDSWTQDESLVGNQWAQPLTATIIPSWSFVDSPVTNIWEQFVPDTVTLSRIQSESPEINLWALLISETIILPWPNAKYSPISMWQFPGTDNISSSWLQTEPSPENLLSSLSDTITVHWPQDNSLTGNLWSWTLSDIMAPIWTQTRSPGLNLLALLYSDTGPSNETPSGNILSDLSANITTPLWIHTESPIFSLWILQLPDTVTTQFSQTEFPTGNIWPWTSDTVPLLWDQTESYPVNLWTPLLSEHISSSWPPPKSLSVKFWTLPVLSEIIPTWLQSESKAINTKTVLVSDTFILPWTQSKYQTVIPSTEVNGNMFPQWTDSEVLVTNSWIHSVSDTILEQIQPPKIKHWALVVSDPVLLRKYFASPTIYFWKNYGVSTFTEWHHLQLTNVKHPTQPLSDRLVETEISATDSWTKLEIDTILWIPPANSGISSLWTEAIENTAIPILQDIPLLLIPWKQFESDMIKMSIQPETSEFIHSDIDKVLSPTEYPLAFEMRGTDTPWKLSEISVLKSWKPLSTEMVSQWIIDKSSAEQILTKPVFDKIFLFTHAVSPTVSWTWTQIQDDRVMPWTQTKFQKKNAQTNSNSELVLAWSPNEFSQVKFWTQPEAGAVMMKQQALIPKIEDIAKIVKLQIQTESSAINLWAQLVANLLTTWTQRKSRAINYHAQSLHEKVTLRTQTKYPLINSWIQEENIGINPNILSENHLVQPPIEAVILCKHAVYSTFNSFLLQENTITEGSWAESQQIKYPLKKTKLSKVIQWTQSKSSPVDGCIDDKISEVTFLTHAIYQLGYHWTEATDSNIISWSETESYLANIWTGAISSEVSYWTQAKYSLVKQWIKATALAVIPWTQGESLPEESLLPWIRSTPSKVIHWFHEESIPENPGTEAIFSVITWTHPQHMPVDPWTQPVDHIYTKINKWVWPSYNSIIWAHSESPEVIVSIDSVSETWSKALSTSEKLWTEVVFSTSMPWTQFMSSSTVQSIYDTSMPWAKEKFSGVVTCMLSDSSVCISWAQSEFLEINTRVERTGSTVTQKSQVDPPSSLWAQNRIATVTMWTTDESRAVKTVSKTVASTVISWIQPESPNKIRTNSASVIVTTHKQTESPVVQLYTETKIQEVTFLTVIESEAKETLAPAEVNIFRISMQPQTYMTQAVIQTAQTSLLWAHSENVDGNTWSLSIFGTYFSLKVPISLAARSWPQSESYIRRNLFKMQTKRVGLWTGTDFQTLSTYTNLRDSKGESWVQQKTHKMKSWTQSSVGTFKYWTQSEIEGVGFWTVTKGNIAKLWFQVQASATKPWIQLKTITVGLLPLAQTQIIKFWTHSVSDKIAPLNQAETEPEKHLDMPDFNAVLPWFQIKHDSVTQRTKFEPDTVTPWIQPEWQIVPPWNHLETMVLKTVYHIEADTAQIPWIYAKSDEIKLWTQPESQLVRRWPEDIIVTIWSLTENDAITPWSQFEYEAIYSWEQHEFGITKSWIQHAASTENLEIFHWTHYDPVIPYRLQTHIHSVRLWNQPYTQTWSRVIEQVVKAPALMEVDTVAPSFQTQDTLFNEEFPLMPVFQSGSQDKYTLEEMSLKQSSLNVSLAECRLSMIWKDSLQALWLFKTAVVSHETTECGLRPGLVPHCPNCWEAEIGEFPWIVSLQLSFSHFCAGSILNEQWILTSARCANFIKRSEALALVEVGLVDLQDPAQGQIVGIHHSMPYLGPRGPLGPGLIFLKEPLHFQPLVLPICLEESQEQERNIQLYDCWLPSWSLMRGSPGILQKRHLSIIQVITCAPFWPQLNEFTFCVEAKKAMGESGCKGDLGAPLVCHIQQKDTWVQVGILSHFDEHCTKPYVFSQVSPFIFWLQRVTQPSHAPWSHQRRMTTSASNSLSVYTSKKVSTFTSPTASIHRHFISLPHPQVLADHISVQYTMPWQAMIFSCGNQVCSGSIISSYWVLTAAHCVRNMNPEDTVVLLGLRHPGTPLRVVKVTNILLHERFRLVSQTARNDLALILLQEGQSFIHILAPLGHIKNLNNSECWLSGPQILKPGEILQNPEMLQIQVMGASNCAYLYPDIGSSTVCFATQIRGSEKKIVSVSPGSAVMCRPISGNVKWRQIGFTSLKHLATIVSPHFSWILSTSAKAGYPLNQAFTHWAENPNSSSLLKHPTILLLSLVMVISVKRTLFVQYSKYSK